MPSNENRRWLVNRCKQDMFVLMEKNRVAWGKMGQLGKMGHLTNDSFFVNLRSDTVRLNKRRVVLKPTPYWTPPDVTRTYQLCIRP